MQTSPCCATTILPLSAEAGGAATEAGGGQRRAGPGRRPEAGRGGRPAGQAGSCSPQVEGTSRYCGRAPRSHVEGLAVPPAVGLVGVRAPCERELQPELDPGINTEVAGTRASPKYLVSPLADLLIFLLSVQISYVECII